MKEYGGYYELDTYRLPMLHEKAVALNCGRNALAYLLKAKKISKICMPYFMCDCVHYTARKYGVALRFYHVDENFKPVKITLDDDEWLYVMNYYGQLTEDDLMMLKNKYRRIIVDNAQAYFDEPINGVDTLYTCRKFFGVADGAFLYTDVALDEKLTVDESYDRMHFVLGRYERSALEFYAESVKNNNLFDNEPIKIMSKLTKNLLHGIDYEFVRHQRTKNYQLYYEWFDNVNQLNLHEIEGAFAYPLWIEKGSNIRKQLQQKGIYVPTIWPNVLNDMPENSLEYRLANDILPLPCDQRYGAKDIMYICEKVMEVICNEH